MSHPLGLPFPESLLRFYYFFLKNLHDPASQYRSESSHLQLEPYGEHTPDALECSKVLVCFQVTVQSIVDFISYPKTPLLPNERGLNLKELKNLFSVILHFQDGTQQPKDRGHSLISLHFHLLVHTYTNHAATPINQ